LWEAAQEKTRLGIDGEREWEALGALVRQAARHFEDDLMAEHSAATAQTCAEGPKTIFYLMTYSVSFSNNNPKFMQTDPRDLPLALAPLLALEHWVVWRWALNSVGKWTKIP
jgi:hypothetical protein